jgi:hypothetical protein
MFHFSKKSPSEYKFAKLQIINHKQSHFKKLPNTLVISK